MKKRTCKPGYTKKEQRFDQMLSQRSGIVQGSESTYEREARRFTRQQKDEAKRSLYARQSGKGARECARRAGV